jgi:hypothetical protein
MKYTFLFHKLNFNSYFDMLNASSIVEQTISKLDKQTIV